MIPLANEDMQKIPCTTHPHGCTGDIEEDIASVKADLPDIAEVHNIPEPQNESTPKKPSAKLSQSSSKTITLRHSSLGLKKETENVPPAHETAAPTQKSKNLALAVQHRL